MVISDIRRWPLTDVRLMAVPLTSALVRRLMLSALLAVAVLGVAGCQDETGGDVQPDATTPPSVAEGEVLVKSVSFTPRELRATVGKPVTWRFDDGGLEHTVTGDNNEFDSGRMSSGTYARTFDKAGNVNYHCTVHSRMRGTVIVSG
jgi:plastocyanin